MLEAKLLGNSDASRHFVFPDGGINSLADVAARLPCGLQVVRKGDDAKAHKELNQLGGDAGGGKEMDVGKAQEALTKVGACGHERFVLGF